MARFTRREFLGAMAAGAAAVLARPTATRAEGRGSMSDAHVPQYGRWQTAFSPETHADRVEFIGPDDARTVRPTFLHQPAALVYDDHGYETTQPEGEPVLAVRFTPTVPGRYRYRVLSGTDVVTEGELQCDASSHAGYVGISARDSRYFAYSNGEAYCAIGLDVCWPSGGFGGRTLGAREYRRWFRQLSEAGGNFARLWVGVRYFNPQGEVAGELDPAAFARLDAVVELARQYGIRLKLCLEYFRAFDRSRASQWITLRDRAGQACTSVDDWFEQEHWQSLWWRRVEAYVARYGDDPTIMAWELWNEINCCDTRDWSVQREWTRRVLPMLKAKTPRNLVTNSIGSFDTERFQSWYDDFKMPELDFQQVHRYLDQGAPWDICHLDAPAFSWNAVERTRRPDRPVLLAETGAVNDQHSGSFRYYRADHRGLIFHDVTYPAFFAGAAGTGHIWHWDEYVDNKNLWGAFRPFADLLRGVKIDQEAFRPADLSNDKMWCYALFGRQHVLLWIRNRADSWYRVLRDEQEPGLVEGQRVNLGQQGIHSGRATTIWPWGDGTGEAALRAGQLHLPSFRSGMLVKVALQ